MCISEHEEHKSFKNLTAHQPSETKYINIFCKNCFYDFEGKLKGLDRL
jgi:hypothetical protein